MDKVSSGQSAERNDPAATLELDLTFIAIREIRVGIPAEDVTVASIPRDVNLAGDLEPRRDIHHEGLVDTVLRVEPVERRGRNRRISGARGQCVDLCERTRQVCLQTGKA